MAAVGRIQHVKAASHINVLFFFSVPFHGNCERAIVVKQHSNVFISVLDPV